MKPVKFLLSNFVFLSFLYTFTLPVSALAQIPAEEAKHPILVHPPQEAKPETDEEHSLEDLNATIGGIFRMWSTAHLKPSAKENQLHFKVPRVDLVVSMRPAEKVAGRLELSAGPTRDATSSQWDMMVAQAYLEFLQVFNTDINVRYGLVPNMWVENQATLVDLEFATNTSKNFLVRYGYSDTSDQGFTAYDNQEAYGWAFAVVNGEGEKSDEQGYGKEGRLLGRWSPLEDWRSDEKSFSLVAQFTEGSYENVGPEAAKRRIHVMAKVDQDVSWGGQAEVFWGTDPVDAINNIVADQVDLTDRGGETAESFGYSARVLYSWRSLEKKARKYQAFARYDNLNPMRAVEDRGLSAYLAGFSYFPARNLQFSLALGQVEYQDRHSTVASDSQEINFATVLGF